MAQPKISIITVCFNSADTIRTTIESILHQSYDAVEYLIIDGASTDNTVKIAVEYQLLFQKRGYEYHIYSEPDQGIYDAMNKGIRKATGDIVGILNSNDWFEDSTLGIVARTFGTTKCELMYADIRMHKEDGSSFVKKSRRRKLQFSRDWNHPTTFVASKVYQEEIAKSNTGNAPFRNEGIHDDYEFFLRMNKQHRRIEVVHEVLADFSMGGISNQKSWNKSLQRMKDRYRCYRINGYSRLYFLECLLIEMVKFVLA